MEKSGRKGQFNDRKIQQTVRLITFNTHGKLSNPDQREMLMTEMREKRAMVVGLQETRWKEDSDISIPGLGRIINLAGKSDNENKKYGMGFIIAPEWEARYMGVKYISDRIAIIQFRVLEKSERPLVIINVYGPTQSRTARTGDTAEVEEFYAQLKQIVEREKARASILLVCGDFNSRIGQQREGRTVKSWDVTRKVTETSMVNILLSSCMTPSSFFAIRHSNIGIIILQRGMEFM